MIGLALKETQPGKLWAKALQGSRQLKHTLRWHTVRGSLGSVRLILTLPKQRWGYKVGCFPFVNTLQWPAAAHSEKQGLLTGPRSPMSDWGGRGCSCILAVVQAGTGCAWVSLGFFGEAFCVPALLGQP